MPCGFTRAQQDAQESFAAFADEHLVGAADRWDREQALPESIVQRLAAARYLVATVPTEAGGSGMDATTYGLLTEEIGRGCASVRNLMAVQGMVAHAILRWGTREQADRWVARIATGEALAAFALTEPDAGSDARSGSTRARAVGTGYVLDGHKAWISFGARADVFLVFALLDGETAAFLLERGSPGLSTTPTLDLLGLRASHLAEVSLEACEVPAEGLLSAGRLTFDAVATGALDYGRFSAACGSVGLAEACLRASMCHARERTQFGTAIAEHQLVQRMLSDMVVMVTAARLLCRDAGAARVQGLPDAVRRTLMAKYFASTSAFSVANDTVQIHGASGCGPGAPAQRFLRDAKIQEIIEGTTQIQQIQIAQLTMSQTSLR